MKEKKNGATHTKLYLSISFSALDLLLPIASTTNVHTGWCINNKEVYE